MPAKLALVTHDKTDKQALEGLRAQIDRIDIMLHDLLRERAEIIDHVRKVK